MTKEEAIKKLKELEKNNRKNSIYFFVLCQYLKNNFGIDCEEYKSINDIEEFKKYSKNLWEDLSDDLITDEDYFKKEKDYLMKNGSNELFDYLIDKYKNTKSETKYINYKSEFNKARKDESRPIGALFLTKMINKEEFKRKYAELDLPHYAYFDPFPFENKISIPNIEESNCRVTYRLYNGLLVSLNGIDKSNKVLSMNISLLKYRLENGHNDWNQFLHYICQDSKDERWGFALMPDNNQVTFNLDMLETIKYVINYYNYLLNKELGEPDYPNNWFEVMKILCTYEGGPVGIDGDNIACYCFAAPREFFKYFRDELSNNEIAKEIFYANV